MEGLSLWLSALSCSRWFTGELYIMEMKEYPKHVLEFKEVKDELHSMRVTMDDEGWGWVCLLILGLFWRLWTLSILVLLKYSEGGSCLTMIKFVIGKQLTKC